MLLRLDFFSVLFGDLIYWLVVQTCCSSKNALTELRTCSLSIVDLLGNAELAMGGWGFAMYGDSKRHPIWVDCTVMFPAGMELRAVAAVKAYIDL